MTMYKATISDGRTITVFGETFRQANRKIDEYIKYHYGFRSHKMDYELEKVVEEETKGTIAFELDTSCHEYGCKKSKKETKHTFEWLEEEKKTFGEQANGIAGEIVKMLVKKNEKYGDKNLCKHGHLGIMVRLSDKLARLEHMIESDTEIDEDIYKDIAGYAINALRLMREGRI